MRRVLGALGLLVGGVAALLLVRRARLPPPVATAVIVDPQDSTVMDESGAVRSVQAADLTLPEEELAKIWDPTHLERLARTYWRFLTRATLGVIRVKYTERERFVCLLVRPLVLLSFQAPEYEMDETRGIVRWRIEKGVLVSRQGRGGDGFLEIDVSRHPAQEPGKAIAHVEVEVANFYPAIASGMSRRVYKATQSFIHVLVTHGFLRSLARLNFARSRVGRFAAETPDRAPDISQVPDPPARAADRPDTPVTGRAADDEQAAAERAS